MQMPQKCQAFLSQIQVKVKDTGICNVISVWGGGGGVKFHMALDVEVNNNNYDDNANNATMTTTLIMTRRMTTATTSMTVITRFGSGYTQKQH